MKRQYISGSIENKLEAYSIPEPTSGCVLWIGGCTPTGYAQVHLPGGRGTYAHIAAYVLRNGPVPEGKEIDHLCKVRCCINPRHLEAVTRRENLRRSSSLVASGKFGEIRKAFTHCPNGHLYPVENTSYRKNYANGAEYRSCRICAKAQWTKNNERRRKN